MSSTGRQPLVLLGGMLGDATVWDGVVPGVHDRAAVRVCQIDRDDTVSAMAAGVLAVAPPQFALAGHSLGGIVALEAYRQAPHRVTRLGLVNSSARGPSQEQLAAWSSWRARVEAGEFAAVAAELASATLPSGRRAELARWNLAMARTVGAEGFLRQLAAQATRPDSRPGLGRIAVPTLVITGELDQTCPAVLQAELAAAIPSAEHHTIQGAGHMCPVEAPTVLAGHLRSWLAR